MSNHEKKSLGEIAAEMDHIMALRGYMVAEI
jgi:hypothetical protein